jgi:hypothetical protein
MREANIEHDMSMITVGIKSIFVAVVASLSNRYLWDNNWRDAIIVGFFCGLTAAVFLTWKEIGERRRSGSPHR